MTVKKLKISSAQILYRKKMPENLDNSPIFRAFHTLKTFKYNLGTTKNIEISQIIKTYTCKTITAPQIHFDIR